MGVSHQAFCAVRDAIKAGQVVHAAHPDFGGVVTIGLSRRATGETLYETIHHGGTEDTGDAHESIEAAVRSFVYQVGKRNALKGALEVL